MCAKAGVVSELRSDEPIVKPFGLGCCNLFHSEARRASLSIPPGAARRAKGKASAHHPSSPPKPEGLHQKTLWNIDAFHRKENGLIGRIFQRAFRIRYSVYSSVAPLMLHSDFESRNSFVP